MKLSNELIARGFINQFSSENLSEIIDGQKRTIYLGVDPSADSIQAGNFALFMLLRHFVQGGHKIIFLIGGGTGMIGDPKPDVERNLSSPEEIEERVEKLSAQAKKLLGTEDITFVNNKDWLGNLNLIDFLRDTGKHFTVNELIKKEAIASRVNSENGISYTEFAYPLLQAFDYLTLNREYGCDLQIGGSDQWGNIIAGVDLIRKKEKRTSYALTIPLVIDKTTGKKFGKSEGNSVWLDAEKTSPFSFYQFWLNIADENVIDYLKIFTFLNLSKISDIEKEQEINPGKREAQNKLAEEVTKLAHGEEVMNSAKNVSEILFGGSDIKNISEIEKEILLKNAPTLEVTQNENLLDVIVNSKLATSKREARTFIESGAIYLTGVKIENIKTIFMKDNFESGIAVLKRGKKQLCVLVLK